MENFRLDGKTALITGASKGIGFGIAEALARAGADVLLVARNSEDLRSAALDLQTTDQKIQWLSYDLGRTDEIATWYGQEVLALGAPDVLVNNAGITRRAPAEELSLDDWQDVIDINVTATFELSKAFAKERLGTQKPGKIINIASLMTFASRRTTAAYTASKGAIGQLTKNLAIEWGSRGIWVNAIAPGYIKTPLNKPLVEDTEFSEWVQQRCPMGRWGHPDDIGGPAVFLASSASDFVNGVVLLVDGGLLATF